MFDRRLKIFLGFLTVFIAALLLRAAQFQIASADYWRDRASYSMKRLRLSPTTRGRILDAKGREVAADEACIDLCVDYRAITAEPDEAWVRDLAQGRLRRRLGDRYGRTPRKDRARMLDEEVELVKSQIKVMWARIAQAAHVSPQEIDDIRQSIIQRVEARQRAVSRYHYHRALKRFKNQGDLPWYRSLFFGGGADEAPKAESFDAPVAEQLEPHVVIRAFSDTNNEIGKNIDQYPGLSLRASKHRVYPFGTVGAHLLGRLSDVNREDLQDDPNEGNDLRQYLPNDQIGRTGIEALCEQTLRGSRGSSEFILGSDDPVNHSDAIPGRDVRLTLDMDLESAIQDAFIKRREYRQYKAPSQFREKQHGACIILDLKTNNVLAMVSYPSFDPNTLDQDYARLLVDDLNKPLMNRATRAQYPPGSTAKTMVGSGGITDGIISATGTIECTGYLIIDGRTYRSFGKCWVAREYARLGINVAHHQVPSSDPHPTGFLTVSDGLQRSCNVFFETLANRMGIAELHKWFSAFGLGRPTGIGISESSGRIPDPAHPGPRAATWFAGIGQGDVAATPLQMANVAATLARGGIWMRPKLVADADVGLATTQPVEKYPDRVDLHLSPEAVAAVQDGMRRVVNTRGGTGTRLHRSDMIIAGKTGSAQTGKLAVPLRDADGQIVKVNGRTQYKYLDVGTPGTESWYIGGGPDKDILAHGWVIGFAPADHPKIAFCAMVEFGLSGGLTAADVANDAIDACIRYGYLTPEPAAAQKAALLTMPQHPDDVPLSEPQ
jgi:penicillin-binding protein 2